MITIQINKLNYKVFMVEPYNGSLLVNGTFRIGACDSTAGTIHIQNELTYEIMRLTIIHELVHAYICAYGHDARKEYGEEDVCEFMSAFSDAIIYDTNAIMKHYGRAAKTVGGNITTGTISTETIPADISGYTLI